MHWNDGVQSFIGKTRAQLCSFHFRLLDQFGAEEFAHNGTRILPFLKIDSTDEVESLVLWLVHDHCWFILQTCMLLMMLHASSCIAVRGDEEPFCLNLVNK